ncbi:Ankyrin repeat-containing domain protein [Metarhizium guizhouense ARSEF 977]|uniref:phospholipase A2 n=1 Tax=Metarhizium guizhouense (strain ARSEF 977) TaxID=1276136 RepID=A0A0B4G4A8_METGA|nr:Ankyrin repeat-containing domain protein [Metarhizium guizhouense ARSEF 977]
MSYSTSSGAPLRILTIDGGGVRGISSLYILKDIMAQVKRQYKADHPDDPNKKLRPCDVFDLICGTSTGGLIALMLGRLKMDVSDVISQYGQMSKEIFTANSYKANARFDHEILEKCIKNAIVSSSLGVDADCLLEDESKPKTFVISTYLRGSGAVAARMRTYSSITSDPFEATIWEVARATSAAPTFFKSITIDGIEYGDGGTGWNNPAEEAINEAHRIWPRQPIACLVSLGTGLEDPIQLRDQNGQVKDSFVRKLFQKAAPRQAFQIAVAEYCVKSLTSCETVHQRLNEDPARHGLADSYFRLNVPQGMSQIGLEEWNKMNDIKSLTIPYMETGDCYRMKQKIAKVLLNPQSIGIAREKDKHGRTALHRAALRGDLEEIEAQLNQGADINAEDQDGWTPLICALKQDHFEAFKALITYGADINKPDKKKFTPLHLAFGAGDVSLSQRKDYINFKMTLISASRIKLDEKDHEERTPLLYAVMSGSVFFVNLLLGNGADVNDKDNLGRTAMHHAVFLESEEMMEMLFQGGADINAQDDTGQTPLHWAGGMNKAGVATWLCDHGGDTKLLDKYNKTALQVAIASQAADSEQVLMTIALRNLYVRDAQLAKKQLFAYGVEEEEIAGPSRGKGRED